MHPLHSALLNTLEREIVRLRAELEGYRDAAQYDALMSGAVFKGWNRSALDRARRVTEARIAKESADYD